MTLRILCMFKQYVFYTGRLALSDGRCYLFIYLHFFFTFLYFFHKFSHTFVTCDASIFWILCYVCQITLVEEYHNGFAYFFQFQVLRWFHIFGIIWIVQFIIACHKMTIAWAVAVWYFTRYGFTFFFTLTVTMIKLKICFNNTLYNYIFVNIYVWHYKIRTYLYRFFAFFHEICVLCVINYGLTIYLVFFWQNPSV